MEVDNFFLIAFDVKQGSRLFEILQHLYNYSLKPKCSELTQSLQKMTVIFIFY